MILPKGEDLIGNVKQVVTQQYVKIFKPKIPMNNISTSHIKHHINPIIS
jgi:hypothetical protein